MKTNFVKQIITSVFVLLAITGCAGQSLRAKMPDEPVLSDFGQAPELNTDSWLNSDQPIRLENLRGKVVLVEMWTFG